MSSEKSSLRGMTQAGPSQLVSRRVESNDSSDGEVEAGYKPGDRTDDNVLERLGYKRELGREFTSMSTLSFALSILGCVATIASTVNTPLLSGGPATVIWAWFLGSWGCIAIAFSVAELASAYPTSGGLYSSTAFVYGPKYRVGLSYLNAWITFIGQLANDASVNFALTVMIFAARTMATDGEFVASTGQILGLYCGINVAMGVLNALPTRIVHSITKYYMWIHLATCIAVIIAIPVAGKGHLASSEFVWRTIIDGTGWNNKPFAFLLGLLSVQFVMTDYDAPAHLSEETKNAAFVAPVAIVTAVTVTAVLGFWINVALCYGIRDFAALPGPTQLVFAQILWDNLGKRGALILWSLVVLIQAFTGSTCQLACIRSMYAISRDGALPDKKLLSRVSPITKTPVNAAIFTIIMQCLFGLLYLASFTAVNAVFSITAVALDISYMIPTFGKLMLYFFPFTEERDDVGKTTAKFKPGPFFLGKWGYAVNAYAVMWTIFETAILIMPQIRPVTPQNMNYSGPIIGAVILLSVAWYFIYGKKTYHLAAWDKIKSTDSAAIPESPS